MKLKKVINTKTETIVVKPMNLELQLFGDKVAEIRPIHKPKGAMWQKKPKF